MIQIALLLCLLPVSVVWEFVYRLRRAQTAGDRRANELAIASHGVGFLALAGLAAWIIGPAKLAGILRTAPNAFPDAWMTWVPALAFIAAVAFGLYWSLTGGARSLALAGDRDARFITRALLKVAAGIGMRWLIWHPPANWPREVVEWIVFVRTLPMGTIAVVAVTVWLVSTGLTRFLLVALPAAGNAEKIIARLLQQRNAPLVPARTRHR